MESTLITSIVSMFINGISDKSKAKQIIETILKYCNDIAGDVASYLKNGYLPAVVTTGLPQWAIYALGLIPEALALLPDEAKIQAFLTPIIESLSTQLSDIEAAITKEVEASGAATVTGPVTLTSVNNITAKIANGKQILSAIPGTAHTNIPVLKKVWNDLETLVESIGPEVVALLAAKK